jgi:hypothetical protein
MILCYYKLQITPLLASASSYVRENNIKTDLKQTGYEDSLDSSESGYSPMMDSFEHENKLSSSTKDDKCLDQLGDYQLLKNAYVL